MVNAVTIGRKKYMDYQLEAQEGVEKGAALRVAFLDAMEHDTDAFNSFSDAMNLPKETPEEKAVRSAAMQVALALCIESPLRMMEISFEAMKLTEKLLGKTNVNALSDLGVAALMLGTAVKGAWLNVLINLGSLKDEAQIAAYRLRGEGLLRETLAHSQAVYDQVLDLL